MANWEPLDNHHEYLYLIKRKRGLPDVRVHLSDAYEYSRGEYFARPTEVMGRNSFVVLGDPNAYSPSKALVAEARNDGTGSGSSGSSWARSTAATCGIRGARGTRELTPSSARR